MGSGDPMFGRKERLAALAASTAGALLLAGCSAGDQANAPPPRSDYQAESSAPDLMGAPPPQQSASRAPEDGLLGGPAAVGDTSTQARADAGVVSRPLPPPAPRNSNLKTWRRPDGTLVTAMRPIPNPKGSHRVVVASAQPHRVHATIPAAPHAVPKPAVVAAAKPAPVAKPVTPKTVAPTPAPVKAAQPIRPTTPLTKPPAVAFAKPVAPAAPVAAKPTTKLGKLQAAVASEATNGAVLAAGESLSKNQPGQVTLSLPATLGDLIKKEAAKLGLAKAAKKTSAYASLEGEGYEITPNGRQTAVVKPGEPTTFAWQVKPGPEAKGQLKSDFGVELNGAKQPQGFALGTISKRVAALPEEVKKGVGGLDLGALNGTVDLPGLGKVSLKTLLGAALVLLALVILVGVSRNAAAARRRAERQRKYRTMNDYGRNEMEFEPPAAADVSYVNPFVAAASGAAAGAAATAALSHHDDHQARANHEPFPEPHPEPPVEHPTYANPFLANSPDHGEQAHHDDHHKEPEPAH